MHFATQFTSLGSALRTYCTNGRVVRSHTNFTRVPPRDSTTQQRTIPAPSVEPTPKAVRSNGPRWRSSFGLESTTSPLSPVDPVDKSPSGVKLSARRRRNQASRHCRGMRPMRCQQAHDLQTPQQLLLRSAERRLAHRTILCAPDCEQHQLGASVTATHAKYYLHNMSYPDNEYTHTTLWHRCGAGAACCCIGSLLMHIFPVGCSGCRPVLLVTLMPPLITPLLAPSHRNAFGAREPPKAQERTATLLLVLL